MKLAFCLFNYFPYGGLQRDFLRIARLCRDEGHEVHVFTMRWEGAPEPGMQVHVIPVKGWQNHSRIRSFAHQVKQRLAVERFDVVAGFNKMPYLDVYYAADVCYQARAKEKHGLLYRCLPRYRQLKAFEQAVFARGQHCQILLIAPAQKAAFIQAYQTEEERFHVLPPGISRDRIAPANAEAIRAEVRHNLNLSADEFLLLMVGSGFKTKGLDRAIKGLAALPAGLRKRCQLMVVGQDEAASFKKLADKLEVADRVHFMGGRPDVTSFLLAADVLLHPAYHENTGTVLLEALVAGLPVLTVDVCGYAHYVIEANAGMVLSSPFHQETFNDYLEKMLLSPLRETWRRNGILFAGKADIYSLPEKAACYIYTMI